MEEGYINISKWTKDWAKNLEIRFLPRDLLVLGVEFTSKKGKDRKFSRTFFLDLLPMLKRDNPTLMVTSMIEVDGIITINFEEKIYKEDSNQ